MLLGIVDLRQPMAQQLAGDLHIPATTVSFQFVLEFLHVLKNDVFVAVPIGLRT